MVSNSDGKPENAQSDAERANDKDRNVPQPPRQTISVVVNATNFPVEDSRNSKDNKKNPLEYLAVIFALIAALGGWIAAGFGWYQGWVARDAEQRQLRAYVGPTNDAVAMMTGPDRILVTMKNFGLTPAKSAEIFINWEFVSQPADRLPDGFKFPDKDYCPKRLYGAQVIYPMDILKSQRLHCPDEIAKLSAPNTWTAFIYGHIIYFDVFGYRWRNNYCFLYGASQSAYCERYNEIDAKE